MHTIKPLLVLVGALGLVACHHVEATHNRCGGEVAGAKGPCDPVEILSDRPARPFRELGVVEVRVDRGTALRNPTLEDVMPALVGEARKMGADAVILTHEEFASWYDKGEKASPIHDLERQESWYITEKARYVSGLAVVYTGCAPAMPRAAAPTYSAPVYGMPVAPSGRVVQTRVLDSRGNVLSPASPVGSPIYTGPAPSAAPPPPPAPMPAPPPAVEVPAAPPAVAETPPAPPAVPEAPVVPEVPSAPPAVPDLPPVPRPEVPEIPEVPPAPPADAPVVPK